MPQGAVVSPRTLEKVSSIIDNRDAYDADSLLAAMQGTIGHSAAESMMAFIRHDESLPSFQSIVDNPLTAKTPTDEGAAAVLCFGLLEKCTAPTLTPIVNYLERLDLEWQAIFCAALARHKTKQDFAYDNRTFAEWCAKNQDIL